jgi:sialic acid synthase SpsE
MNNRLSRISVNNSNVYIIGEIGLNHNGSIEIAKKLIDIACNAGCDAVKFQKRTVEKLAVNETLNSLDSRFPEFGKTYKEIRNFLEFDFDDYQNLKEYTEDRGLDFFVTAFDLDAVDFLEKLNIQIYKIASHSVTNLGLLEYLSSKNKPVIMSTGMADMVEISTAVNILKDKVPLYLMHCVSAYPTPENECNLRMLDVLNLSYKVPVGYSGHELGYFPTIIAVARGAKLIERHITLDKKMNGFDHKISLEPDELNVMIKEVRRIEEILGSGNKNISATEMITRDKYHVSMASACPIKKGTVLSSEMVNFRNPGTGIPYKEAYKVMGKIAVHDIDQDVLLNVEMFS